MPLPTTSGPLPVPQSFTDRVPAGIAIQSSFFALLTAVTITFVAIFARHEQKTRALWAMLGTVLLLWACASTEYALEVRLLVILHLGRRVCTHTTCITIIDGGEVIHDELIAISFQFIAIFLNDCIVVWRAWTLWRRSKLVLVTSGLFVLATLGLFATALTLWVRNPALNTARRGTSLPLYFILVFATSIATNLYATVLVGIRTWQYWRAIRATTSSAPFVFKIMLLLVESGAIYVVIWVVYLLSLFSISDRLFDANFYFNCSVPYAVAMYPAILFILVGLRHSAQDEVFTGTILESLSVPMRTISTGVGPFSTTDFHMPVTDSTGTGLATLFVEGKQVIPDPRQLAVAFSRQLAPGFEERPRLSSANFLFL
ncbi:hypothetical protein K488DRAFT_86290 [Vararia minispora EC-137]|uniref:Uncharacterized protein n=1 Tax=Vararia minispora EC-137 TaxID=1314806 RepID=A0ACB8QJE6_9AGAM|nr:hypothetical protein K488DRAFT_86290 [Vararia minispora EC-137]